MVVKVHVCRESHRLRQGFGEGPGKQTGDVDLRGGQGLIVRVVFVVTDNSSGHEPILNLKFDEEKHKLLV